MSNWRVTILHDACTSHDVTADTEAEAMASALEDSGVTLCHRCSDLIELGDPIRTINIENLDTGENNDEADPDFEVVQLRIRVAELEAQIAAERAYWQRAGAMFLVSRSGQVTSLDLAERLMKMAEERGPAAASSGPAAAQVAPAPAGTPE